MKIRTLIVDDEPLARARLTRLLSSIDGVTLVGTGSDGLQAVELASNQDPDLIFMDIQMPKLDGLGAAKKIIELFADDPPTIIFCTAYDQYAMDAFKVMAADYLLKPISVSDLQESIQRACQASRLSKAELKQSKDTILVPSASGTERIPLTKVCYFRCEEKNVVAGLEDGPEVVIDYTLKELSVLFPGLLLRVHRNALCVKQKLRRLERQFNKDYIELYGCEKKFLVSRRMLNETKRHFKDKQ